MDNRIDMAKKLMHLNHLVPHLLRKLTLDQIVFYLFRK